MMRELQAVAADGHAFAVRLHEADAPRACFILCPAMGVAASYYDRFALALAGHGITAAITDLRGQGSSSLRAGRACNWGYADMVEQDWPALQASVRAACPDLPLYFFGHSQGGQLSLLYLARRPPGIAGALTIACGSTWFRGWPFPHNLKILAQTQFVRVPAVLFGHFPGRRLGFGGRQARAEMGDWADLALHGRFRLAGTAFDYEAGLGDAAVPVAVFSLEGDDFAPFGAAAALAAKLPPVLARHHHLTEADLPAEALDHFRWSRHPDAVIPHLLAATGL